MKPIEIIVIIACVFIVVLSVIKYILDKKKNKNSCGGNCGNCPYNNGCSTKKEDK